MNGVENTACGMELKPCLQKNVKYTFGEKKYKTYLDKRIRSYRKNKLSEEERKKTRNY